MAESSNNKRRGIMGARNTLIVVLMASQWASAHAAPAFMAKRVALGLRSGSQNPDYDPYYPGPNSNPAYSNQNNDPYYAPIYGNQNDPYEETVQDRVDSWRQQQMEQASTAGESNHDDQGRVKLLASVSKGSRAFIFLILMFRNIHFFEQADQTFSGLLRLMIVTPLVLLFIGNLAGVVASFTAPSHSSKKRLKAILNLDKLLEALMIVYYFGRLTIAPSKYVPREVYVGRVLHAVVFILQCQAFTKLSWDDTVPRPMTGAPMVDPEEPASPPPARPYPDGAWQEAPPRANYR